MLAVSVAGVCGLASTALGREIASNQHAEMHSTALIHALRSIGKPVCTAAADALAMLPPRQAGFDLHLRRAGLDEADARILAEGMLQQNDGAGRFLRSFSASYNAEFGDAGAAVLAAALPVTVAELGLVSCAIGDAGGRAILNWVQAATDLQMVCVEGNCFSAEMKSRFCDFARRKTHVLVVV
jgi:hypothetical protein